MASKTSEQFVRFVKARRQRLGLTQGELTEKAGLSLGFLGMLESGKRQGKPRDESLNKLARGLKLPAETTGELKNFLELIFAGVVPEGALVRVAEGARAARVLTELTRTPAERFDEFSPLPNKFDRLDQVLHTLEEDLEPDDYRAVAHLLRRFYDLAYKT